MAESFFIDVAKSLGLRLASYARGQLLLAWGLGSEVDELKGTIRTINAYLKDVEETPGGITTHGDGDWVTKLRNAVYAADDVFDEIVTIAERKRLMEGSTFGNEVKLFCSSSNQLITSISLARRIKSIRESLQQSYDTRNKFGVIVKPPGEAMVRGEIGNLSDNVVGRDKEKTELMSMLLDSSSGEAVCVIPIVGIGGLGKSTLARYVFNDEQVKANFDLHLWVALPEEITLTGVMAKIVAATGGNPSKDGDLDQLKMDLSGVINGKKYILILDNVWNEDVTQWRDLERVLTLDAAHGSRIIVTTRLSTIAQNMGTVTPFELQPLEGDNPWSLLESLVFGKKGCQDPDLKKIGWKILPMCYNVPLAVRALAGVLANDIRATSWLRFQNDTVSNLASHDKSYQIMPILQLSYDKLRPSRLKSCFSYCSLFPKGYEFDKDKLVILWIAQGFIEPLHKEETLENEGAEYLDKLLNKGLLQHIPGDKSHTKCKLHDLMHDLCCSVAAEQCQLQNSGENNNVKSDICHISIGYDVNRYTSLKIPSSLQSTGKLRTLLLTTSVGEGLITSASLCHNLMASFPCLRVLDLKCLGIERLPKSLGKLIHLRYLDLFGNNFKRLPNSISMLHNLQYLDISYCRHLIEMPKDMNKLVNLRHLLVSRTNMMRHFPPGLGNLTNLQTLDKLLVGKQDQKIQWIPADKRSKHGCLGDLKRLNKLQGNLHIYIEGSYENMGLDAGEACLKAKTNLRGLSLVWKRPHNYEDELVLEKLQPHAKILELTVKGYGGEKLPKWMATKQLTSSLVDLEVVGLYNCAKVKHIPSFSQLPNLKVFALKGLPSVEYLGSDDDDQYAGSEAPLSSPRMFFPSLTKISISRLPNLKGWREVGLGDLLFPCVSRVKISQCDKLEFFPSCPNVEDMAIRGVGNVKLLKEHGISSSSSSPVPKLKSLEVHSVDYLASLPRECLLNVSQLAIRSLPGEPADVSELEKGLEGMTSLKYLKFWFSYQGLISFSGFPVQLSTLQGLQIYCSFHIPSISDGDQSEESWRVLKSLRFLLFYTVNDLKVLPRGMRHLATLQSLELRYCENLEAIPDWIGELCSLSRLKIVGSRKLTSLPQEMMKLTELKLLLVENCPELGRRCQRDTGEDWHKIQHIEQVITR